MALRIDTAHRSGNLVLETEKLAIGYKLANSPNPEPENLESLRPNAAILNSSFSILNLFTCPDLQL